MSPNDRLEHAVAAIPSCALTEEGLRRQRERMLALGPSVTDFQSLEDSVTIEFSSDFDRGLLDEALAVERECCPFFRFDLDEDGHQLTVSVDDPKFRAGLDALVHALGVAPPAS